MPHLDEMETKVLDKKTALEYKYPLLKLMIDMENSQIEFLPDPLKRKKWTEKEYLKDYRTIDRLIEEIYEYNSIIIGSFHKTNNNKLVAFLLLNVRETDGISQSWVSKIYVDPYYRRIRVGKLLLNLAIEELKNHKDKPTVLILSVLSENTIPKKIYNLLGFKTYVETKYLEI